MDIQWLVFDLGAVVLSNDWHDENNKKYQEFAHDFGLEISTLELGWKVTWDDYKIGKMSEDKFWRTFLIAAGSRTINVDRAKFLWRKYQEEIPGMLELLPQLKKKYSLAVLSNTGKEWLVFKRKQFQLDRFFDVYVGSGDVGVAKPDPKIYEILLSRLQVPPDSCVFVDDLERNLTPARSNGMKTILFSDRTQLERDLRMVGIRW